MRLCHLLLVVVLAPATLAGFAHNPSPTALALSSETPYRLDSGHRLGIGQDILTSSYAAYAAGQTDISLIGAVPARRRTTWHLRQGCIRDPKIAVEIDLELRAGISTCWRPDWPIRIKSSPSNPRPSGNPKLTARPTSASDKPARTRPAPVSRSVGSAIDTLRPTARQGTSQNVVLGEQGLITKASYRRPDSYRNMPSAIAVGIQPTNTAAQGAMITAWIRSIAALAILFTRSADLENSSIGDPTRMGALY